MLEKHGTKRRRSWRVLHIGMDATSGQIVAATLTDRGVSVRARVESQIGRWKRVIGDALRFHTDEAQATEVTIAVEVLNCMRDLGRPNSVRVA